VKKVTACDRAFQKALTFARRSWLTEAPLSFSDARNHELEELRSIMANGTNSCRDILARTAVNDRNTVEDLVTNVEAVAQQAGFVYGLALGLLLGQGGAR